MNIKEKLKASRRFMKCYQYVYNMYFKLLTCISPTLNTKARYKAVFKKKLDLNNPQTLNEKILWLKLNRYIKDPLVHQCVDKYAVREYVKSCGCEDILIDLIAVYQSVDEIVWEDLPDQFVLKWNFGCGKNIICTDKSQMNKEEVFKQLRNWKHKRDWLSYSEMQYKYTPKKIICEKLIGTDCEEM